MPVADSTSRIPSTDSQGPHLIDGMMTQPGSLLANAIERFDRINAADPRTEQVEEVSEPKELVYARRMSERLARFEPGASEALRLAARAQHIARWRIPRSEYPDGRAGYRRWRARLMQHHADIVSEILTEVGYNASMIDIVGRLVQKKGLKRDPDAQTLEDVVCLVFLEHYFDDFSQSHEDEKLVTILRKTWAKMSVRSQAEALTLPLSERARGLVTRALDEGDTGGHG